MTDADFDKCAQQLRALADPLRLQLVYILFHGAQDVTQLCQAVALETASVSHHLGVLIDAGIVQRLRESRKIVYSLNPVVAEIRPQVLKLAHVRISFTGDKPSFAIVPPAHPWQ
jgi:DNA-binding transcriptional ArsR family regulator